MRTRDSIALVVAALSVAASIVIVNQPLPVSPPADSGKSNPVVLLTEAGALWDCPDEAADG
ncbi:hypothetical protein Q0Z83_033230 [Actinoplanes sichuanensis]|uniref:Uncharacterized protein n=1 Tax=Actinoplanes sichuanensis TaxID=512349 RepID=A0ABW4A6X5_9ACTN|nr:hypothetical protein [Actinoplanes sichuanensis]BEL05132.1 hypothetical protein Q0Z83_033230 [Actinoplanes sichuanensis]